MNPKFKVFLIIVLLIFLIGLAKCSKAEELIYSYSPSPTGGSYFSPLLTSSTYYYQTKINLNDSYLNYKITGWEVYAYDTSSRIMTSYIITDKCASKQLPIATTTVNTGGTYQWVRSTPTNPFELTSTTTIYFSFQCTNSGTAIRLWHKTGVSTDINGATYRTDTCAFSDRQGMMIKIYGEAMESEEELEIEETPIAQISEVVENNILNNIYLGLGITATAGYGIMKLYGLV